MKAFDHFDSDLMQKNANGITNVDVQTSSANLMDRKKLWVYVTKICSKTKEPTVFGEELAKFLEELLSAEIPKEKL